MRLKRIKSVYVVPSAPFDFNSTYHKPDHFPTGDNDWEHGLKWQTFFWKNKQIGVRFKNIGSRYNPEVQINIYYQKALPTIYINSLLEEIKYRYNLELDLSDFYNKFKEDKILSPIIRRWRGMRPGHPNSLYEYLIVGIVLQNTFVKRSIQMLQSLFENFGKPIEYDGKILWSYWKPGRFSKVNEKRLRDLKLGYRAKSIKKIDAQFIKGLINEFDLREKDIQTQKKELLQLYGVGPATTWYILYDVFHHWDFFDHISPWEQKIYSKLFFNKSPERPVAVKKLLKYFERYGEYKQLAVHYIWEDLWWKRKTKKIPWLEKLIRV
jgi:3-methyladenine DNA glycosylase/8-oxoguanine DNA glycosylase